ncbi:MULTISPECIES: transglycosylase family protein [Streptomyces]|uniref:LysM peptidoglycan-binding domain-containing protein n=1 Tax=Streptomyces TaxID=1883 RepID=UPI000B9DFDA4|nr:transglycosylase family protein [Streptomyces kasugaensis]
MSSPLAKRSVGTSASVLLALLSVLGPTGRSAAADFGPSAPPGVDWESIAACESNGRWHTNTGNGYHGGLQIAPATWRAYGGKRYAPRADLASREQQIAVGERIAQDRGLTQWPVCGRRGAPSAKSPQATSTGGNTGNTTGKSTSGTTAPRSPSAPRTHHRRPTTPGATTDHTYVVQPGDCLSTIAQRTAVPGGTQALYDLNKPTLDEGPDHIYPGQRLRLHA